MQILLSYAFRPFFLLSGLFGVLAVVAWALILSGYAFAIRDPVLWHAHEMLVGFTMATIAGFVLTAGAAWTGRPPVRGIELLALVLAWLAGRGAMLFEAQVPGALVAAIDMLFPVLLAWYFGREIFAARNRRNYKVVVIVASLAAVNALYHLGGERIALYLFVHAVLLLLAVIAGRIVPNFTGNWLRARGHGRMPSGKASVEAAALLLTVAAGASASFAPTGKLTGTLALAAAAAHALRLARWCGLSTTSEPLLLALHVAYACLPIGYLVTALAAFGWWFTPTVALHALTMGAIGGMILAMQTRVPLGHTGRKLTAARATVVAYLLLGAAVLIRVAGPFFVDDYLRTVLWSAAAWAAAFTVFLRVYWPILIRPRVDQ